LIQVQRDPVEFGSRNSASNQASSSVFSVSFSDPYSFDPDPDPDFINTDPDPDTDPIRIQEFNEQKLKKFTGEK
jgi:hypothetical protein